MRQTMEQTTGSRGSWKAHEMEGNAKELKAGVMTIKAFMKVARNANIYLQMDNITSVSQITKLSSPKSPLMLEIVKDLWDFSHKRNLQVIAVYLPGQKTTERIGYRGNWKTRGIGN